MLCAQRADHKRSMIGSVHTFFWKKDKGLKVLMAESVSRNSEKAVDGVRDEPPGRMVLRSAWIPAPPPESEPAMVRTRPRGTYRCAVAGGSGGVAGA